MRPYLPEGLLALTLAMLGTVRGATNATSVSPAEFLSQINEAGIVPEVFSSVNPVVSFYAGYKADSGETELLVPGSSLTVNESQFPFEFSAEDLGNVTGVTDSTQYIIYLIDPDAPSRNNPTSRNLRLYLQGNYTLSSTKSSILPTAQLLFVPDTENIPFTMFQQPQPEPHTGTHRLVYALYIQPTRFNNAGFDSVGMNTTLTNWDLSQWEKQLGLQPPIGVTFFLIDTEANGGQGTSVTQTSGASLGGRVPWVMMLALSATATYLLMTILD